VSDDDIERVVIDKEVVRRQLGDFYEVHVFVACHPRVAGMPAEVLPEGWFEGRSLLHLVYGLNQPKPIPDLECGEDGIRATLSFSNSPHLTFVPYEAIVAMRGDGLHPPAPAAQKPGSRSHLKLV
jgi:hypothetical protein